MPIIIPIITGILTKKVSGVYLLFFIIVFNLSIKDNQILQIPVAHNEGNFYCDTETLNLLKNNEQIAFEYCKGEFSNSEENINGSIEAIAGITNKKKNILGMMPHPERAYSDFHPSQDGKLIIESLIT